VTKKKDPSEDESFFLVAGAGQRTFLALPKTLFHSGMLGASTCACPRSTEPGLRPAVRVLAKTKTKAPKNRGTCFGRAWWSGTFYRGK